ncbi:MAG TPA: PIG-L deacetylase family protein, partial [Ilumatobacteraceae bacterium]|nr:PIG-L deacetylase family protein [Ilumatobacteraceae bacterium]
MNASISAPIAGRDQHLVVVVAHPDDESFGCGSLIAQAARAGARVTVICATRGEAGERRPDPTTDTWPIGLLREAELCQAAIVLGVDEVVLLDLVDSGFSGEAPSDALISRPVDEVADLLLDRLADLGPDVVLTLDGSDGHRDHVHLRDALGLAVARLHRPTVLVHSCLARSSMKAWASEMRLHEPHREHLSIDDEQLGRPDDELTVIDTSDVVVVREQAIACHLSQSSPFDNLSPTLRHRFLT